MNENPGETPNPLNPNPGMNTGPSPVRPSRPVRATTMRAARPMQPAASTRPITQPAPTTMSEGEALQATIESLDPTGRPMEQAPVFVDKPKKKTGLIVGLIIGLFVLIGGGVAAALVLINMNNTDAVSAAMNKIMSGEAPKDVAVDGTIDMRVNDPSSPLERVKIDLDSELTMGSMLNTSTAIVTLSIKDTQDVSFEFDEVYAESGDLYLKLEGATNALEDSGLLQLLTPAQPAENCTTNEVTGEVNCTEPAPVVDEPVDCTGEEGCTALDTLTDPEAITEPEAGISIDEDMAASLTPLLGIIETIDGEWLRISTDEMSMLSNDTLNTSSVSCITNLVSGLDTSGASAAELYKKNPFVTSSTENINITSKGNPVYRIGIDNDAFANFVNSIQNTDMSQEIYSCLGWEDKVSISSTDVDEVTAMFPTIYAEVNSEHNFTRLYLESDSDDANTTMIIDLSFNYPSNINITEPEEYRDFSDLIQEIFSSIYDLPDGDTVIEDGVVEDGTIVEEGVVVSE